MGKLPHSIFLYMDFGKKYCLDCLRFFVLMLLLFLLWFVVWIFGLFWFWLGGGGIFSMREHWGG